MGLLLLGYAIRVAYRRGRFRIIPRRFFYVIGSVNGSFHGTVNGSFHVYSTFCWKPQHVQLKSLQDKVPDRSVSAGAVKFVGKVENTYKKRECSHRLKFLGEKVCVLHYLQYNSSQIYRFPANFTVGF